MKRTIILFCVILCLLAGCGVGPKDEPAGSGSTVQTDAPQEVPRVPPEDRNQAFFCPGFVETPDGCYYGLFSEMVYGTMIYFCPRGGDAFRPLCGKPNCRHEDENCNAFCGGAFGYYNGALYSVDLSEENALLITQMNLDGSDHRVVGKVDLTGIPESGFNLTFHHGKLFVMCHAAMNLPLEEQVDHLLLVDLSDFSQKELALDFMADTQFSSPSNFWKDKAYYLSGFGKNALPGHEETKLCEFDTVTGAVRVLPVLDNASTYATDSTLYYLDSCLDGAGNPAEHPGFREYDLQSGEVKDCGMPVEDAWNASYDEDYIYVCSVPRESGKYQTLYILSRDYKLVDQIDLQPGQLMVAVTSDRIYLTDYEPNGNIFTSSLPIAYYLDKAEIGSRKLTEKPVPVVE